jgi:KDO2-lipid IV(A) lauroyltransferase
MFSDVIYIITYYVAGYRKKVVRNNLKNSFPKKTEKEIRSIEKKFYRHFCDYFVETIKLFNMSETEIKKRVTIVNPHSLDEYYKNNKSIFMYLAHYANWEWLSFSWTANHPEQKNYKLYPGFLPPSNKYIEKFIYRLRRESQSELIPKNNMLRRIIGLNREGNHGLFIFIADQSPARTSVQHWMTFLNQETATVTGPEKLAKKMGYPVFYYRVKKLKRGYFSAEMVKLAENANEVPSFQITERYMHEVEKSILEEPAYWLWTHRRWKLDRSECVNSD